MGLFLVKEKVDNVLYRAFNVFSDFVFSVRFSIKREILKNTKYHNLHEGQRCFIVGTGPSLTNLDPGCIAQLSGEVVFGVNSFYKVAQFANVTPKYYVLMDNNYWGLASGAFDEIVDRYSDCPVFVSDVRALSFLKKTRKNINYVVLYTKNYPVDFVRTDLASNLSITMNVIGTSIQAAIYMGFKEIYLLGCDYNLFCSFVNAHSYDDAEERDILPSYNLAFYLKYYHLATDFHYKLARVAKKSGVKIINATDGSLLDAYPFKSLEMILTNKNP